MARRDPVLIVMRQTRVRHPDGRVIILGPGCKSEAQSDRIRSVVSRDQMEQLKRGGRVTEDTPPWND